MVATGFFAWMYWYETNKTVADDEFAWRARARAKGYVEVTPDILGHILPTFYQAVKAEARLPIRGRRPLPSLEPAASLAHEAIEVAQWASQSSAAAAVQQMDTRFASGGGALGLTSRMGS